MGFNATRPELADLNEQLPYPNTIAEAHWLAELASMCHHRLRVSHEAPSGFWLELSDCDANRLHRFLLTAGDGVSNAANDLQVLVDSVPAPLCQWDDVYDIAADAMICIQSRLQRRGIQLESASDNALQLALEKVLGEAEVEVLDNEGTPLDPNEQHRLEVA